MMTLELRDFYYQKYILCQQICDAAHRFCVKLNPALQNICTGAQSFTYALTGESLSHVAAFGDRMKLEASYLAKEMVDIHSIMCPVYHKISPPMSLSKFKDDPLLYQVTAYLFMYVHYIVLLRQTKYRSAKAFIYHCMLLSNQVGAPGRYMEHLRAILDVMTRRFYETEVSIRTRTTMDGDFCTKIAGTNFRRRYRSTKPMTVFEVEARLPSADS
jgi:hypothetical protein